MACPQISWSGLPGRRQLALLLLAGLLQAPAANAQTASAPADAASSESVPVDARPDAGSAAVDHAANSDVGEFYGPVKPAESLWSIANRMRPNKQISTEQVLVAIYRSNPRAFYGSINSLNEGAVLRVPSVAEMTVLNAVAARAELQRLWGAHSGLPAAGGAQPLIDPLKIAPPPPANGESQQSSSTAPDADVADSGAPDAPSAAPAHDSAVDQRPDTYIGDSAGSEPAAPPNVERAAMLAQWQGVASAALAWVTARLAGARLDQWLGLSFAAVIVLVLLLRLLRRRAAPLPVIAPHRVAPLATEPELLLVDLPSPTQGSHASPRGEAFSARSEPVADHEPTFASTLAADPISTDELGTKLDLARAYIEMGEKLLARVLLREVLQQGDAVQRADAEALLTRLQ